MVGEVPLLKNLGSLSVDFCVCVRVSAFSAASVYFLFHLDMLSPYYQHVYWEKKISSFHTLK